MSKILVKSVISSMTGDYDEIIAKAIKKDNKIYFKNDDTNYVIEIFHNHLNLLKEDKEKRIKLTFELKKRVKTDYEIYDPKMVIELETHTEVLKIYDDGLEVVYQLKMNGVHSDTFTYKLTWEG